MCIIQKRHLNSLVKSPTFRILFRKSPAFTLTLVFICKHSIHSLKIFKKGKFWDMDLQAKIRGGGGGGGGSCCSPTPLAGGGGGGGRPPPLLQPHSILGFYGSVISIHSMHWPYWPIFSNRRMYAGLRRVSKINNLITSYSNQHLVTGFQILDSVLATILH